MKIYQLHRKYLFSKINVIITTILIGITILFSIAIIEPFKDSSVRWMNRFYITNNFEQAYITFVKIIMIFFSCYLFSSCFSKNNDNYYIILIDNISKSKYLISKVVTIKIKILEILVIILFIYIVINYVFNQWYIINISIFKSFGIIYLLVNIYGLVSLILIKVINTIYSVMISLGFYLISEILIDYEVSSQMISIIQLFFPTTYLKDNDLFLKYGIFHLMILMALYFFIGYLFYLKKE